MNLSKPLTTTQGQSTNPSSNNARRGVGASLAIARRQRTRPRVHRVHPDGRTCKSTRGNRHRHHQQPQTLAWLWGTIYGIDYKRKRHGMGARRFAHGVDELGHGHGGKGKLTGESAEDGEVRWSRARRGASLARSPQQDHTPVGLGRRSSSVVVVRA